MKASNLHPIVVRRAVVLFVASCAMAFAFAVYRSGRFLADSVCVDLHAGVARPAACLHHVWYLGPSWWEFVVLALLYFAACVFLAWLWTVVLGKVIG